MGLENRDLKTVELKYDYDVIKGCLNRFLPESMSSREENIWSMIWRY